MDERLREDLVRGLEGEVVEIGAGSGLNFAHHPGQVQRVTAIEPEPTLRAHAHHRALMAQVGVTIVDGTADHLPLPDGSCDGAVACLVLCSVGDQASALNEIVRVLRPGGELRFYEHVAAGDRRRATIQRLLDRSRVWPSLAAGCHLSRDTLSAIRDAGLVIDWSAAIETGPARLAIPHIHGVAHRPEST